MNFLRFIEPELARCLLWIPLPILWRCHISAPNRRKSSRWAAWRVGRLFLRARHLHHTYLKHSEQAVQHFRRENQQKTSGEACSQPEIRPNNYAAGIPNNQHGIKGALWQQAF